MNKQLKQRLMDLGVAIIAVAAGALVIYVGDTLLGVKLELFYGIATFHPLWIVDLFLVPFLGGIVVAMIYGLGGKILAHFAPLIVRLISYYQLHAGEGPPPGSDLLPLGYWLLVVIVAVEFASIGGVVGEIVVKRTYGREGQLHKRRRRKKAKRQAVQDAR